MKLSHSHLRKLSLILRNTLTVFCCSIAVSLMTQAAWSAAAHASQESGGEQKGADASPETPFVAPAPVTCESFATLVDNALVDWQGMRGTYMIIIVRPGAGERASLNKSRLRQVEEYLRRHKAIRYVTAEAAQVKGSGRLEIYIGGKLLSVIPIKKNAATVCSGKVNPFL